jgi:hypothetical protein
VAPAQIQDVFTVENDRAVDIEEIHDRVDVRVMFETQQVADFVHGCGVNFSIAHLLRHHWANRDLSLKVGPIGELRSSRDRVIQKVRGTIDNSNAAYTEVCLFVQVCGQDGIPETQRSPKTIGPRLGRVDLDTDIPQKRLSQIIKISTGRIGTLPVRSAL